MIGLSFFLLNIPFISSVFTKKINDSNASGAHRTCTIQSRSEVNLIFVVVVVFERVDLVVSATLKAQMIELFFLLN